MSEFPGPLKTYKFILMTLLAGFALQALIVIYVRLKATLFILR